jgi:hypothetical protein
MRLRLALRQGFSCEIVLGTEMRVQRSAPHSRRIAELGYAHSIDASLSN